MKVAVCHANWMPERSRTLRRLLGQVPSADVLTSSRREHATQWAYRAWEWVAEQLEPCVLLNDDVTVCPNFLDVVEAMTEATGQRIISLHTSAPSAAGATESWVRCYWLTGPGYILWPEDACKLLDYWSSLSWEFASRRNEDNCAIHYMWEQQQPAWNCIPAVVTHDTSTASSLGYDKHPLRSSSVSWETHDMSNLTSVDYWRRGVEEPHFVENPWATSSGLAITKRLLQDEKACHMCWQRLGLLRQGGVVLCGSCIGHCVNLLLANARVQ